MGGDTFSAQETIATLESVKAVGEVYAPVECEVIEVNEVLEEEPAMVNSGAMGDGWLVKVKFDGDAAHLMDKVAYAKHLEAAAAEGAGNRVHRINLTKFCTTCLCRVAWSIVSSGIAILFRCF